MENILEFIIMGVAIIIAFLAITFFLSSQIVVQKALEQTTKSDIFSIDNATSTYEEQAQGHEVIVQIYNDNKGIVYKVIDSSNTLKITISNCKDLYDLVAIDPTKIYDISKQFSMGKLTQITYKER